MTELSTLADGLQVFWHKPPRSTKYIPWHQDAVAVGTVRETAILPTPLLHPC